MFKAAKIFSITLMTLLLACNDSNLPSQAFSQQYTLSDFTLNDNYQYWEIRIGNIDANTADEVIYSYDSDSYANLSQTAKDNLAMADANDGFSVACLPFSCPIYGVALIDGAVILIQAKVDLQLFFAQIDTEAELFHWLLTSTTEPSFYEKNQEGYRVVLKWNNLCGLKGENLVQVYPNGEIEVIKELSTEKTTTCV